MSLSLGDRWVNKVPPVLHAVGVRRVFVFFLCLCFFGLRLWVGRGEGGEFQSMVTLLPYSVKIKYDKGHHLPSHALARGAVKQVKIEKKDKDKQTI